MSPPPHYRVGYCPMPKYGESSNSAIFGKTNRYMLHVTVYSGNLQDTNFCPLNEGFGLHVLIIIFIIKVSFYRNYRENMQLPGVCLLIMLL